MKLTHLLFAGALLSTAGSGFSQANHLLISEVGVNTPTQAGANSSEYAEIFNPTGTTVSLDNYYLSDHNGTTKYWNLPALPFATNYGDTDYLVRFPTGTTVPPGGVVVVTQNAETFLTDLFTTGALPTFLAQSGSPQLFEVTDTTATVANMINGSTAPVTPGNFNKTNSSTTNGEFMVLLNWDQASDTVKDVDLIQWGNPSGGNLLLPKTASNTVDGPDGDAIASPYALDSGTTATYTKPHPATLLLRLSSTETGEAASGGNGITGNDETTENVSVTWSGSASLSGRSPGTTTLTFTTPTAAARDWDLFE